MIVYSATSQDVTARVWPIYLDEASNLLDMEFAFSYAVHLYNQGPDDLLLIRRRFTIREGDGRLHDAAGSGETLEKRPIVPAGEKHVLDERCTLHDFDAVVEGNYVAQRPNGQRFRIMLPSFPLHAAAN